MVAVKAGKDFEQLYTNPLGEYCLTTPAISDGAMIFRCHRHVIAIEQELTVQELMAIEENDKKAADEQKSVAHDQKELDAEDDGKTEAKKGN